MNIAEFKEEITKLIPEVGYINKFEVVDETTNTIKARLVVNKFCFVQLYINFRKDLKNHVVILNGQRVYGRDCDGGRWHKHPWNAPTKHEFAKEIPLKDFLFEVYEGLRKRNIL